MEERLKSYLKEMEAQSVKWDKKGEDAMTEQEKKRQTEDLLIQIGFFQHERLIHLIHDARYSGHIDCAAAGSFSANFVFTDFVGSLYPPLLYS